MTIVPECSCRHSAQGRCFLPSLQPLARLPRPTSAGRSFPQRPPRTDRRCTLENVNRPLLVGSAPRAATRGSPIFRACRPSGQSTPAGDPSALVQTSTALRPFRFAFGSSARVGRPLPIAPCYPRLRQVAFGMYMPRFNADVQQPNPRRKHP